MVGVVRRIISPRTSRNKRQTHADHRCCIRESRRTRRQFAAAAYGRPFGTNQGWVFGSASCGSGDVRDHRCHHYPWQWKPLVRVPGAH